MVSHSYITYRYPSGDGTKFNTKQILRQDNSDGNYPSNRVKTTLAFCTQRCVNRFGSTDQYHISFPRTQSLHRLAHGNQTGRAGCCRRRSRPFQAKVDTYLKPAMLALSLSHI